MVLCAFDGELKRAGGRLASPSSRPPAVERQGSKGGYGGGELFTISGAHLAESRNLFQALIDLPLQRERIELRFFFFQPQLGLWRHFGTSQHPSEGRFGGPVNACKATFRAFFALQLETGVKVI